MHPALSPRSLRAALATWLTVSVLVSTGCSGSSLPADDDAHPGVAPSPRAIPAPTEPMPSAPDGLGRFYRQRLTWEPCTGGFVCTTVQVPLDYADPSGDSVGLAVSRRPAEEPSKRTGALLVNPGGPGVSGVDYAPTAAAQFRPDVQARYDIVGFDPRGVAGSEAIDCLSDDQLDAFVASDPTPDDDPAAQAAIASLTALGRGCVEGSGRLTGHVSTVEAARDLDIIRSVLRSPQLHYYGASYGTLLGATYADLFPERVGAMVLDGAIDPTLSVVREAMQQARGFQTAADAYLRYCVEQGDCPLGDSVPAATRSLTGLLASIDADPLPGSGGRELTVGHAVLGLWLPLYAPELWPTLSQALSAAIAGDGSALLRLSDFYTSRGPNGYRDNTMEALYAVNCLDHPSSRSIAEVRELVPRFEAVSPLFGEGFAWGLLGCGDWPVRAGEPMPTIHAQGAPPIVVVGTTRDPATPYQGSVALAEQLRSGVLVTREGDGHTGFKMGSECVDDAVNGFFASGAVPRDGLRCS
ncbi:MAG: alpha/beta fold hydrolase [Nocardioidaceae bacterium]